MAVEIDILEGHALSHDFLRGWEITRIAIVQGLQSIATVTLSGTTTNTSAVVTMASTAGVLMGMNMAATGIPVPAKVIGIVTNTSVTLSIAATASATVSLVFGSLDTAGLGQAAEGAVIAVTGNRGAICPNVGVPTFLKTFQTDLIGPDAAKVKIVYAGYPLPTIEFDGTLNQVESNKDSSGALITVQYTYPSGYLLDARKAGQTFTQGGMISRSICITTVVVRWVITDGKIGGTPATATEILAWFKTTFEGFLNNASYTLAAITGAARTWKVDKVAGVSRDGGQTYEAAMTFQYKPNTWDQLVVFINPDDGKPPPDLVSGTGYKMVQGETTTTFPTFFFPPN